MRKGFTLIELLAVIVILAIVALIATPLILNVIDDSRKSAFKNTAYGIIEAAEIGYAQSIFDGSEREATFIYEDGIEYGPNGKSLDYKGAKPKNGVVKINEDGHVSIALYDGKYCVQKNHNQSEVILSEIPKKDCIIRVPLPGGGVCGDNFTDNRGAVNGENVYATVQIGSQCWMAENLRYVGEGSNSCLVSCTGNKWDSTRYNQCCIHTSNDGVDGDEYGDYTNWNQTQVLYQWRAAMNVDVSNLDNLTGIDLASIRDLERTQGICPDGWVIPSDDDWTELALFLDSVYKDDEYWKSEGYLGFDFGSKLKSPLYWNGINGEENSGFNGLPAGIRYASGSLNYVGFGAFWWTSTIKSTPQKNTVWWYDFATDNGGTYRTSLFTGNYGLSIRCILNQ